MAFKDESYNLRTEVDTKHCELSPAEWEKMKECMSKLEPVVNTFPVSDLYVTITRHPRTHDFHVTTAMVLAARRIFTGERDRDMYPAFQSCIGKLVRKVEALKQLMGNDAEIAKHVKGTHKEIMPSQEPDGATLNRAVDSGDYRTFRLEMFPYEEPVRKRVGRWIERYPELDGRIGQDWSLADIVEEVFLNAFDQYGQKPQNLTLGTWLESLIDPSVRALLEHPDEERENIRFAQTLRETEAAGGE